MNNKVSIVMTTYNGQKYIYSQLDSLRKQTYTPAEVIIRDDNSTDETVNIIKKYIERYHLTNWFLKVNKNNVGWKQNFWKVLHEANNEFIFLSDQDDVWSTNKVKYMRDILVKNPKIGLLISDYFEFKNNINLQNLNNNENSNKICKIEFNANFLNIKSPGCCFALRRKNLYYSDNFWSKEQPHDFTLLCSSILLGNAFFYKEPLIYWRVHKDSADYSDSDLIKRITMSPKNAYMKYYKEKINYLNFNIKFLENAKKISYTDYRHSIIFDAYDYYKKRISYIKNGSIFAMLETLVCHAKSYDLKLLLEDLYLVINKKLWS